MEHPTPMHELAAEIETINAKAHALHNAMEAALPAHPKVQDAHKQLLEAIRKAKNTASEHLENYGRDTPAKTPAAG